MNRYELLIRRSRSVEPPAPAIPTDYVFRALLENNLVDTSQYHRTLSAYGATPSYAAYDGITGAMVVSGSGLYSSDLSGISSGNHSRCISFWHYLTSYDGSTWSYMMNVGTNSSYKAFVIGIHSGKYYFSIYSYDVDSSITYQPNAWHHFLLNYDSSQSLYTLYIDGVGVASGTNSSMNAPSNGYICLNMGNSTGLDSHQSGVFRNVVIYDRSLSLDEIDALAHESLVNEDSSSSDQSDSSSSDIGTIPTDYDWYTPFSSDYEEKVNSITGVPTSNGICSIVSDSRFGGYLNMNKTSSGSLTGLEYPGTQGALAYGNGAFAISYWLNAPSWNSYGQAVISHRGNGTGFDNKNGFVIFKDTSNTMDIRIGSSSMQCKSFSVQTNDTWHHCLYQRNADGTWGWYEDGVLKTSGSGWNTGHDATSNANVNVMIGGDGDWGKSAVFKMCRLRIYNRALSALEIQALASEF